MNENIYMAYKREARWIKAKRFMQDATVAMGASLIFVAFLILAAEIELFFEVAK